MKLNNSSFAKPRRLRGTQVVVLGTFALAVHVACSDEPPASPMFTAGASGSGAGMTSNTGGTPSTAGTFNNAGTFNTAGMTTGGGGAGTAGSGGASGGTPSGGTAGAGTAGTGIVPQTPYCMGKALLPLPYTVGMNYYASGWSEGPPAISNPTDLAVNACMDRVVGAVGECAAWRYTPHPDLPKPVWVIWNPAPNAPTQCLAEGANSIAFCARGVKGGEKIQTGGAGVTEAEITLEADWKVFTVPLTGVTYNTFEKGVPTGFVWKVVPPATGAVPVDFFIDNIQFVKDAPTAAYCTPGDGGGSGGAGGAGP